MAAVPPPAPPLQQQLDPSLLHDDMHAPRRRLSEPVSPTDISTSLDPVVPMPMAEAKSLSGSTLSRPGPWGMPRRTIGILLLMVTVFLWTVSNFLASYIFSSTVYNKPFFLVYVNTSFFTILLVPVSVKHIRKNGGFGNFAHTKEIFLKAWREEPGAAWQKLGDADEDGDAAASEGLLVDDEGSFEAHDLPKPTERLTLRQTFRLSLEFCMLWFLANYLASACLEYTAVGSATILGATSSVWTLIFCAILKIDPFTIRKLVGVLASLAGIIMISMVDLSGESNDEDRGNFPHKSQKQIAIGDTMALVGALVYGVYVVVMKQRIGNEERVNMQLFFGLVGALNMVVLIPLFPILHWTGIETFEMPPSGRIWFMIIMNSFTSFIADMSWAYAMLFTTPLVVTVGVSLSIPLSLIGEMIQYAQYSSFIYWVGALIVLMSFVFVNNESQEEETDCPGGSNPGLNSTQLPEP